ncbi:MAG: glycoside hydrolase family 99-like domain-containing protein, partial [Gammaproteobacteria bacterium]|nr:glycoside hydrolase family 99-like domain-containing protein [Gammaproteobacteria bacterium]
AINSLFERISQSSLNLKDLYSKQLQCAEGIQHNDYLPLSTKHVAAEKSALKLIAFYLPQFHPLEINDKAWGKGFTEWTNVSKAIPQFRGHYQPRLPGELGFYDLRVEDVQKRQIELARQHGIYGFCYYHYWFAGKRVMEKPLQKILGNPNLDLPFCLCWANENWTRRWDGGDQEVLINQEHSQKDDIAFIQEIEATLKDSRYIRINGKPLLLLYRPMLLPDPAATADRWREYAREKGIGELYIVAVASFGFSEYEKIGFDGLVQFPPHDIKKYKVTYEKTLYNKDFCGQVFDYTRIPDEALKSLDPQQNIFPGVMMEWDNEARKPGNGRMFYGCKPEIYQQWLDEASQFVINNKAENERIVFINAWNEWAEGTYLEPDRKNGYAYLSATANVVEKHSAK